MHITPPTTQQLELLHRASDIYRVPVIGKPCPWLLMGQDVNDEVNGLIDADWLQVGGWVRQNNRWIMDVALTNTGIVIVNTNTPDDVA